MNAKKVSESFTVMTEHIMPNDTNALHDLMGGNLMRWIDVAAAICAGKHTNSHVVTISVDQVTFKKPIPMGDVITLEAKVTRAFNTSVEIFVEVYAADITGQNHRKCNDAFLTFVAVDKDTREPKQVPAVIPLSDSEQQLFEGALRRRELRLLLSGRIKPEEATNVRAMFSS